MNELPLPLPILVIEKIFNFLTLSERLKCKLISKQWKLAIETSLGPQSLCISQRRSYPRKLKWCFSKQSVIHDLIYSHEEFRNLKSRIDLFRDLQKLCFDHVEMSEFMQDLPLLGRLKVLMIEDYIIWKENQRDDKNLHPRFDSISLEKLSFRFRNKPSFQSLDFDTPNLEKLIFWRDRLIEERHVTKFQINFQFPLKTRHLECIEFDSQLSVLKNLETLITQTITCPFSLEDYKSLRRLELFPREKNELDYIKVIIDEKITLKRDSLEITVCGFRDILTTCKQKNDDTNMFYMPYISLFNLNEHFLGQIAKHSKDKLVGHIPWQFNVDFKTYQKIFKDLPKNLFTKFHTISCITISDLNRRSRQKTVFDQSDVLQLLIKANPREVRIVTILANRFTEKLGSIQSIEILDVRDRSENLDYDHFLKLKYLRSLKVFTEKLPIEFIFRVFKLKFLMEITFSYSQFYVSLGYSRWLFPDQIYFLYTSFRAKKASKCLQTNLMFQCLEDLVEELENLKVKKAARLRGCLI